MLDDAIILRCLDLRTRGVSLRRIGAQVGVSHVHVCKLTDQVLAADLAESGEPEARVRAAYWPIGKGARRGGG